MVSNDLIEAGITLSDIGEDESNLCVWIIDEFSKIHYSIAIPKCGVLTGTLLNLAKLTKFSLHFVPPELTIFQKVQHLSDSYQPCKVLLDEAPNYFVTILTEDENWYKWPSDYLSILCSSREIFHSRRAQKFGEKNQFSISLLRIPAQLRSSAYKNGKAK
jgi:hypothetical protein